MQPTSHSFLSGSIKRPFSTGILIWLILVSPIFAATPPALRVGVASHAFDHLGNIGNQSGAATASGVNIIYGTGIGSLGYEGLPVEAELSKACKESLAYNRKAKAQGVQLAIGYVCATSIVHLNSFDKNWSPKFRAQFHTLPAEWRQKDQKGKPLPSWYGGEYQPACMNNPDWRTYEKAMVRMQLESGHDGIFFDNPTVHPQGCYCTFCLEKFGRFYASKIGKAKATTTSRDTIDALWQLAIDHPREFMEFRSTIARDFMAEMRNYARTLKRYALITCNNSLNSADVLFSQSRTYGYNIYEMSKTEDLVVVEDMSSQPRTLADGQTVEYGPTYKQLQAISHGKPVVAVTIADADYHTAPNLVRLAMAEAAANGASYLSWPTWPENVRQKLASTIRPQAEFLRQNQKLLNDTKPRSDVLLFSPFRRWLDTDKCTASVLAAALNRADIQYSVSCEDDFEKSLKSKNFKSSVLLVESLSVLNENEKGFVEKFKCNGSQIIVADQKDWLTKLQQTVSRPSIVMTGPATMRAVVHDQRNRTLVHLYNLNVEKLSSFDDKIHPAKDLHIKVRVPFERVHSVHALTADQSATTGDLEFTAQPDGKGSIIELTIPHLEIATILCIEKQRWFSQ
ncbi:MAG: hypothetical protein JWQ71_3525 [Pedosphaera sp.]|nr:hypothetical protein [Pedosphaera sp.]